METRSGHVLFFYVTDDDGTLPEDNTRMSLNQGLNNWRVS